MTTQTTHEVFPMTEASAIGKPVPVADYGLKNVRKTVGREGEGMVAEVVRGRTVIGEVADYGDGGGIYARIDREEQGRFDAFLSQQPTDIYGDDLTFDTVSDSTMNALNYETQLNAFVFEFDLRRTLKRMSKKSTVFIFEGENPLDGFWHEVNQPFSDRVKGYLKENYPNQTVLVWVDATGWTDLSDL